MGGSITDRTQGAANFAIFLCHANMGFDIALGGAAINKIGQIVVVDKSVGRDGGLSFHIFGGCFDGNSGIAAGKCLRKGCGGRKKQQSEKQKGYCITSPLCHCFGPLARAIQV